MEKKNLSKNDDEPWRVLEFYSGIGGMRYSLTKAGVNAQVVEAFDINDTANDGNIQSLTADDLDSYNSHAWLLSPPCQPYTRQGLQKQSSDARAFSFLKILELIQHTMQPPLMLFVENVVGFETSDTHTKMIEMLAKSDYVTQEFILSPLQFGVPYSRPRYFCLAKRKPLSFGCQVFDNQLLQSPTPLFGDNNVTEIDKHDQQEENWDKLLQSCDPIERFLEFNNPFFQVNTGTDVPETTGAALDDFRASEKIVEENGADSLDQYLVPFSLIERWGSAMGTGSLLATIQPKNRGKSSSLNEQGLRYFTPREVANFHSFPEDFEFPQSISLRQRYALLGNSLSIAVVAPILKYLFAQPS
ncbi:hypothetical protein EZV62_013488 [Acer yangbiense]|uniref:DNA (cytosine-5-)-methyltransferase n=1 Tax=Acer yangbiense TaxID=1000413 RepID=A0A5C7HZ09_9ROSI|nr:hypothetical protein EZV62_013488 [Acer yangbiense]